MRRTAVITGASAGIGAAAARALAAEGFDLVLGARREDRLAEIAAPLGARALTLDVDDAASVDRFCAAIPSADLLVANAAFAIGMDKVADGDDARWLAMFETNVLGVLRVVRALLPKLLVAPGGRGHAIIMGSTSGFEVYPGGAGYVASKHALRALTRTLRIELLGQPLRVTEISPGLVETEFATVRHGGDRTRAKAVYQGMTPLVADDVAACIAFAATRPPHVNIDEIVVRPRDQATSTQVHRAGG
jgi:NADP-dependent 3-hydroxy acid dehydrogenase YdfG